MNAELTVRKTILDHGLIEKGDQVILGLSGGPDSLCLLHILADLQRPLGFKLTALHVNHLMRGEAAAEDVNWLSGHCRAMHVPLTVDVCNVYKMAEDLGISVEEAGRKARHMALKNQQAAFMSPCGYGCLSGGTVKIALAHNRDDQAETVLMRAMRGTGIHGLAAMEYAREDGLIRPLLDTPRKEIESYCERKGLAPRWDSTNADKSFTRNRMRLDLIPLLEKEYNPNLKEVLARLAANAREDDGFIENLARKAAEGYKGSFPVKQLAAMEPALAKRVVRIMFAREGLTEDIASIHLNKLLEAVKGRKTGKIFEFPHGYIARITHEAVVFEINKIK